MADCSYFDYTLQSCSVCQLLPSAKRQTRKECLFLKTGLACVFDLSIILN